MFTPAEVASWEVFVLEVTELELLRLKHAAVPPIEENPETQAVQVELLNP